MTKTTTLQICQAAVEDALANWIGEDPDDDMVECVASRVLTALEVLAETGSWGTECDLLVESSSTYVISDLDEKSLADYVGCIEDALEEWGLL